MSVENRSVNVHFSLVLAGFYGDKLLMHRRGEIHCLHSMSLREDMLRIEPYTTYSLTAVGKMNIQKEYPFFVDMNVREKMISYIVNSTELRVVNIVVFDIPSLADIPAISPSCDLIEWDNELNMSPTTIMFVHEAFKLHQMVTR